MLKPTLVSDVRSVLRRSLPASDPRVIEFRSTPDIDDPDGYPPLPEGSIINRARDVMNSLQAATALSRLFPGTPLVLLAFPEGRFPEHHIEGLPEDVTPLPMREVSARPERVADLATIIRSSLVEEFESGVPAAAEALLGELGVVERQDRAYFMAESHDDDSIAAYNYRQRRRKDILAELLELKHDAN
jgi:hypothetical protein